MNLWTQEEWEDYLKYMEEFTKTILNTNGIKPNNNAPKSIKGDYNLSIHGNKIVLVDNKDNTTVEARCHHDDGFDIGAGIKEAFKKMNEKREEIRKQKEDEDKKIKIGDWVEIVDSDKIFLIYSHFFSENNIEHLGKKFRYGCQLNNGNKLKVEFIKNNVAVIKRKEKISSYGLQDCVYLMRIDGLRKVANPHV